MLISGHRSFGRQLCKRFEVPDRREYRDWSIVPDMRFWWETRRQNRYLHRFTLHGMPNVGKAVERGAESDLVKWKDEYEDEIRALVVSHSFLDLFNAPIVPSYPRSRDFKYIPKQKRRYIKVALNDPPHLDELFKDMLLGFETPLEVEEQMRAEYHALPDEKGWMVRKIEEHYDKHS